MEVILLEKIRNLGSLGDRVKVKPGFGRNYLIPQSKAVFATAENIVKFEQRRAELEKIAAAKVAEAVVRQKSLETLGTISISAKVGEEGKLFGSIGTIDLAEAFEKAGIHIEKSEIRLPEGTLRMAGEHELTIELHSDVMAKVKINIVDEGEA